MQQAYHTALFRLALKSVNTGIIVLDGHRRIVVWNWWMARYSFIPAEQAAGKTLGELFSEQPSVRLEQAIHSALADRMPSTLSQTLNKAPLPLFASEMQAHANQRVQQAIQVIPIAIDNMPVHCMVQITDVSPAVQREALLRQQAAELRSKVLCDGLTGIANRLRFNEHIAESHRLAIRNDTPLSLLMIDIDFFKQYNDHYGHLQGDQCLIAVATRLHQILQRPFDLVARFGGEEFVAILPNTDRQGAIKIGEDMRCAVEDLQIQHVASSVSNNATISIGAATQYPTRTDGSIHELIQMADEALYCAKAAGRNRLVCHAET